MSIADIEAKPLSIKQVESMLVGDNAIVIHYDDLANVSSLSELMNLAKCVVILLEIEGPEAQRVGHFILMLNHGDHYEHFDSYGLDVDEELALTHEKRYLTTLIGSSNKAVENAHAKLQEVREDVQTCGRWVVLRCKLSSMRLQQFNDFISSQHQPPDIFVTALTKKLFSSVQ